jgi:hypothetical protein
MSAHKSFALLLLLCFCCTLGCNDGKVSVRGQVTLDGAPLADAGVVFIPVESGPSCSATTNAQGYYELESANKKGVKPGKYQVAITKQVYAGGKAGADGLEVHSENAGGGFRVTWLAPKKYSDVKTSELTADVTTDSGKSYDFLLKK